MTAISRGGEGHLEKFERVIREGPGMKLVSPACDLQPYFCIAERWIAPGIWPGTRAWRRIGERRLGSLLPSCSRLGAFADPASLAVPGHARVTNEWKGWMRLRSQPKELVKQDRSRAAEEALADCHPRPPARRMSRRTGEPHKRPTAPPWSFDEEVNRSELRSPW